MGLIISDISNPFLTSLIRGIKDVANARGYALVLCNTDERLEKEQAYVQLLRSRRVGREHERARRRGRVPR
jgi:LacI family transcriptional regulator